MQLIYTSISPNYCPDWGTREALRELVQEGLDVRTVYGCRVDFRWENGWLVIEDDGPGLPVSALALGVSGKRDNEKTIGQFGEGLKLACLVLAREGRVVEIETVGRTLEAEIVYSSDYGCEVLGFYVRENDRPKGARIKAEATKDEAEDAMGLFLELSPCRHVVPVGENEFANAGLDDEIFLPGGTVYVQGAAVLTGENTKEFMFSYNLKDKKLVNRDRWAVDAYQLNNAIAAAWRRCNNRYLIKRLLTAMRDENYEVYEIANGAVPYAVPSDLCGLWKEVAAEVFGNKTLLKDTSDPGALTRVQALGYRPIYLAWPADSLLKTLGVKTVKEVIKETGEFREISQRELTPEKRFVLREVTKLLKKHVVPVCSTVCKGRVDVRPAVFFSDQIAGTVKDGIIYVSEKVLGSLREALKTCVHELVHAETNARDYTDGFASALEDVIVDLIFERSTRRRAA